jgi:phage antirepressor YoqD-like protein
MIEINGIECWNSRGVAALLAIKQHTLLAYLRDIKVLTSNNLPGSLVTGLGWFTIHSKEIYKGKIVQTTYWTAAGLEATRKLVEKAVAEDKVKLKDPNEYPEFDDEHN